MSGTRDRAENVPAMPDGQAIVFAKGDATLPMIREVLGGLGYTVREFAKGEAVLACLDAAPRDLLVLDDEAHPLGAFSFLQMARPLLQAGKTPAIILCANGGSPVGGGNAAEVFLEQPFGTDDLRDAVETARWVRKSALTGMIDLAAAKSGPTRTGTGLPAASPAEHLYDPDDEPTVRDIAPPVGPRAAKSSAGWAQDPTPSPDFDRPTQSEAPRAPGSKRFKSTLSFNAKNVRTVSTSTTLSSSAIPAVEAEHGVRGTGAAQPTADPEATVFHGPNSPEARRLRAALRDGREGVPKSSKRQTQRAATIPPANIAEPAPTPPARPRPISSEVPVVAEGEVIADRYELLGELGRGGMAVVYRAHDRELDETIALKLLKADKDDEDSLTRFRHELRICRRLQHAAIVQTFEFGVWEGRRFLTMELLDGADLNAMLVQRGNKLQVLETLELLIQAAEGLHAAHRAGVIHRDVKPHNLFVLADGRRLKIMDFGIAKSDEMSHTMTSAAHVLGTPAYLAPERLRDHVELSAATDLYSLGVVLYQALTGKLPFSGPDISSLLTSILLDTPKAPRKVRPEVPTALDEVVMRTLARDPAARQPSCGVLAEELEEIARSLRRAWG
ncbi:MAG: protein kinase [Deltaproteobacteria bacterium]|nr:protein kinase [Deltaproteobacteria bacterium]